MNSSRIPDPDVAHLVEALNKPWWNPTVLTYLHHDMNMGLPEIAKAFGITRQAVHQAAKEIGVRTERKPGPSKLPDQGQTLLSDYEEKGLTDFL